MLIGFLISEKLINQEAVDQHRIKYMPPESLLYLVEDLSFDIWSFGCILIDIFSKLNPIYKIKITLNELCKLHDIDLFPVIPTDINGLMKDLIAKCLDRNYETRISVSELSKNLNILLDNLTTCKNNYKIDF
jgi:serine/threonine protein kinase